MSADKGDVSVATIAKFWVTITELLRPKNNNQKKTIVKNSSISIDEEKRDKPLDKRYSKTKGMRDKEGGSRQRQSGQPQ